MVRSESSHSRLNHLSEKRRELLLQSCPGLFRKTSLQCYQAIKDGSEQATGKAVAWVSSKAHVNHPNWKLNFITHNVGIEKHPSLTERSRELNVAGCMPCLPRGHTCGSPLITVSSLLTEYSAQTTVSLSWELWLKFKYVSLPEMSTWNVSGKRSFNKYTCLQGWYADI